MENLAILAAIIIIIVIGFLLLFYLEAPPTRPITQCSFQKPGFVCIRTKLSASTGKLHFKLGQGTRHNISIRGVSCTQNDSPDFAKEHIILYGNGNNVTMYSGEVAVISYPNDTTKPWLSISCTTADGNLPNERSIGTFYNGRIYMRYTELDTNITRTISGTLSARYES